MYMNSTLQLNPLVRVVAMLILGIALGDVLADVVGVRIWAQWKSTGDVFFVS